MSYTGRITTGDAPSVTRNPALAKLALVIAFVVVIAAATVLIAMGSGAGAQSNVAVRRLAGDSPPPFPGLSKQAAGAVPGNSSGAGTQSYATPGSAAPSRGTS